MTPEQQYTCGNCYTAFALPSDLRCPTCKVREIVPIPNAPEQERAEARKALEEFKSIVSRSTTVFVAEGERGKGIAVSKELLLDIVGRFVDSLDREEQLIAENERKEEKHKHELRVLIQADHVKICNLQKKLAEQDKEIQRLEGIQELWKEINPTVYQMFELISSLYQSYLLDSKQSGVTDPVNIEQWFENLSQFKANSSNQS